MLDDIVHNTEIKSHEVSPEPLDTVITKMATRIKQTQAPNMIQQLDILEQLKQFEFGRYLIQNRGIDGYWTDFMLTYPWHKQALIHEHGNEIAAPLAQFILEKAPIVLATRQRFHLFLQENQKAIKPGASLATIPCGLMGELLYLNYDDVKEISLIGIDIDSHTLLKAKELAKKKNLENITQVECKNAWSLDIRQRFDLISSNGLNIYEPDDDKVTALYHQFYQALKPRGKLVASFLTPPPMLTNTCEWDLSKVEQGDLLLQKTIFIDVLQAKFQCFRSTAQTRQQLTAAGFHDIVFFYDEAHMFPTVVAYK